MLNLSLFKVNGLLKKFGISLNPLIGKVKIFPDNLR